jgi:hypothetical protein
MTVLVNVLRHFLRIGIRLRVINNLNVKLLLEYLRAAHRVIGQFLEVSGHLWVIDWRTCISFRDLRKLVREHRLPHAELVLSGRAHVGVSGGVDEQVGQRRFVVRAGLLRALTPLILRLSDESPLSLVPGQLRDFPTVLG